MAQPTPAPYPVTIRSALSEPLNRWLWLVKWLLLVPHYIVLVFLLIGFIVSWTASLIAILFTGRYPKGLFQFNVGVMRWVWRVEFYAYGALGTDKYPPFTLEKRGDYPADLDVAYPDKLDKGLALVKWWLLAIPHYIVVGIFTSSPSVSWKSGNLSWGLGGLRTALVVFAGVVVLFTGRYPQSLWTLTMGMNHWSYRVCGYAALMTDQYPPFRLGE